METITPIPLIRLRIPNAPPEAAPENQPEGFAQVMARQEKFNRPQDSPVGLEREGTGPKTPPAPEENAQQEGRDPANDPEVTISLTTPISSVLRQDTPNRPWEPPPVDLEDPTFSLEAQISNPALVSKEQIGSGSRVQPGPASFLIRNHAPGVEPQDSLPPGTPGEPGEAVLLPGLPAQDKEGFRIINGTGPAFSPAPVQPEGILKEKSVVSKAFENPILNPAPESLTIPIRQNVSPEPTAIDMKSFQTTTENGPSFSPQGPAIPETTPIVDGLDPSPSLILRETEKVATAPILEEPPIAEAGPVESNSRPNKISATTTSPATSEEILFDRGIALSAKTEGLPDPEKTSPTLAGLDPEPSSLHRAPLEKAEPGIALRDPGENGVGSGEPETNILFRVQGDTHHGIISEFPDQPRIEGVPADRVVEGPPKASPEWIKEALSVYQQYSKGLLRNLQPTGERIQMTLDPPQLGNILMEINRDRNFVTAHLWTDNPHTKELLDFSQGQLQKTLELDGFKLDRFEVLVQPDLKSFQEERWFGGRQPAWENNRQEGSRASPAGLIPTAPETATLRFSQGNQYVDTWV